MATRNNRKSNRAKNQPVDMGNGFFLHYRENEFGLFALENNGAIIYGCRLFSGRNGLFVSYPSRKGSDGKYYSHARFTDAIPNDVIANIADAIGYED